MLRDGSYKESHLSLFDVFVLIYCNESYKEHSTEIVREGIGITGIIHKNLDDQLIKNLGNYKKLNYKHIAKERNTWKYLHNGKNYIRWYFLSIKLIPTNIRTVETHNNNWNYLLNMMLQSGNVTHTKYKHSILRQHPSN